MTSTAALAASVLALIPGDTFTDSDRRCVEDHNFVWEHRALSSILALRAEVERLEKDRAEILAEYGRLRTAIGSANALASRAKRRSYTIGGVLYDDNLPY